MKTKAIKTLGMSAIMALCGWASTASAYWVEGYPVWSQVAGDCTVDDSNINDVALYYSEVSFKSASTATGMNLTCNVNTPNGSAPNPNYNTLWVSYKDPDGTATDYTAYAALYKRDRVTGTISMIQYFNSNYSGNNATGYTHGYSQFTHNFNFMSNYYFVRVYLGRGTGKTLTPVIGGVRLSNYQQVPG